MKDLYNANAMNERLGAFVSALDPEYDNLAGFHFLTTLVVGEHWQFCFCSRSLARAGRDLESMLRVIAEACR